MKTTYYILFSICLYNKNYGSQGKVEREEVLIALKILSNAINGNTTPLQLFIKSFPKKSQGYTGSTEMLLKENKEYQTKHSLYFKQLLEMQPEKSTLRIKTEGELFDILRKKILPCYHQYTLKALIKLLEEEKKDNVLMYLPENTKNQ